ncbi:MAG: hypothetical protein R6W69_06545 [Anaerolineales bacterium]|jgi:hypothetical protein
MNNPSPGSTLISQPLKSNNKIVLIIVGIVVVCCLCFGLAGTALIILEILTDFLNLM